ncbi:MAG: hypothetical protein ACE5HD_03530 [Acidobacteriota bacterium]
MRALVSFLVALGAASALTPLVMVMARRNGLVSRPQPDRWHSRATPLLGGVAIFLSFIFTAVFLTPFHSPSLRLGFAGVLIGSTVMFFLGLLDDFMHLGAATKLIGQVVAACILVYCGVYFDILGRPLLTIPLTILWVVGITNAFNLLDNMDGLASGIAAICALTIFALNQVLGIDPSLGLVALSFAGALLGFLIFNFNPARIFMGDSGSMMIGFTLAGLSIAGTWHQASNVFLLLLVPVLILGVPIFDTTFVTVTRHLRGQSIAVGGRDHTSHRLVGLGLSERQAVLILYGISLAFAVIAVLALRYNVFIAGILVILLATVALIFGMFLGQSRLSQEVAPAAAGPEGNGKDARRGFVLNTLVMHKRRMAEVLIDLCLFGVAFVAAYLLRFEGAMLPQTERLLLFALPIVVPIKLITFWSFGLYRRVWDFMGIHDLVVITKAVLTSSLICIMVLWGLTRLETFSRAAFLMDGILLLLLTAGSRILYRVFQESFLEECPEGKRLLIVGAGQAGALALREIRRNPALGYQTVGFLDDDPDKWGRRIQGARILGGRDMIANLSSEGIDEILIAIPSLPQDQQAALAQLCRATGKTTRIMQRVSSTFLH